ncbi:MAG: glucose-1-phosphate cytidylyltransferase [Acidobacteriia bacterium]|nr:glucose-1-phosphate cytidylyltransferase [Terriglobia bacterium]MBV8902450.1 glucose-1-phosphate cytidylyltransferase [Terriglobia bacterium]MBV9743827.1 glucose-1-phosphate cytidylyltransferase [Terriglobia bacterium]
MKVAILCGGRGTRLREVSEVIPKPMVHVGNMPILWHIMKIYSSHGFHEFVLLLGYKGEVIREFFLNFALHTTDVTIDLSRTDPERLTFHKAPNEPWKVTLADTGESALTGARIRNARQFLEDAETFMVTYGDGVGDVDISRLLQFHQSHGRIASVTAVRPPGRFGELHVDGCTVKSFQEKPQVTGGYINGGFFAFNRELFDRYLPPGDDVMLEREPLEQLISDGQLMAFPHEGFWQPMDTPREYQLLNEIWASGKAPWKNW